MSTDPNDWTEGTEGIAYQRCAGCGHVWYFRRGFCPACGGERHERLPASGRGVVHAVTVVTRAPSDALRPYAPYAIALVDADEGFRLMAHVAPGIAIGDRVQVGFHRFGEHLVPLFTRAP